MSTNDSQRSLLREVFDRMVGCFHMAEDSSSYYGGGGDEEAAATIAELRAKVDAADVIGVPPAARVIRAALEQAGIDRAAASRAIGIALQIRDEQWRAFVAGLNPRAAK